MGRYTKMPVTIEAVQFTGIDGDQACFEDGQPEGTPVPEWLTEAAAKRGGPKGEPGALYPSTDGVSMLVNTLEGYHVASPGDWIIRGVAGELYPCKPDIFDQTYMVEDAEPALLDDDLAWLAKRFEEIAWAWDGETATRAEHTKETGEEIERAKAIINRMRLQP